MVVVGVRGGGGGGGSGRARARALLMGVHAGHVVVSMRRWWSQDKGYSRRRASSTSVRASYGGGRERAAGVVDVRTCGLWSV